MEDIYCKDARAFASILRKTKLKDGVLKFGSFYLNYKKGINSKIQYNDAGIDMLRNAHEYTIPLIHGKLQISLQLYENISGHYRLFAYSKIGNNQGMLFSVNLTTEKESSNTIYLMQKIKFSEQRVGSKKTAALKRRQKQILLCDIYRNIGFEVTENNDLILGIFNPSDKKVINTSAEMFLNNFLVASILKGHFQGNKGNSLDIIPNYDNNEISFGDDVDDEEVKLPSKVTKQKGKRAIPLTFRYQVLKRDNSKCVACGRGVDDNVILHIDHKIPFSLGGLTTLDNLQTLCLECNISKSNRFIDE